MASNILRNALLLLGLLEEYETDDFTDLPSESTPSTSTPSSERAGGSRAASNVRRIQTQEKTREAGRSPSEPRTKPPAETTTRPQNVEPAALPSTGTVNVLGGARQERTASKSRITDDVHVTAPTKFNDVEEIGRQFRGGRPVLMDLRTASEGIAKRVLDFASGLIFGLDGHIDRTSDRIFLLTPDRVDISSTEMDRLRDRGLVD